MNEQHWPVAGRLPPGYELPEQYRPKPRRRFVPAVLPPSYAAAAPEEEQAGEPQTQEQADESTSEKDDDHADQESA